MTIPHRFHGIGAGPALGTAPGTDADQLPVFVSYPAGACRLVSEKYFPIDARELATWHMKTTRRGGRVMVATASLMLEAEMKIVSGRRMRRERRT